jgi:hypothetical protein
MFLFALSGATVRLSSQYEQHGVDSGYWRRPHSLWVSTLWEHWLSSTSRSRHVPHFTNDKGSPGVLRHSSSWLASQFAWHKPYRKPIGFIADEVGQSRGFIERATTIWTTDADIQMMCGKLFEIMSNRLLKYITVVCVVNKHWIEYVFGNIWAA